jgi:hypothetical protein
MAEFMMLMKSTGPTGDGESYIQKLIATGCFRGGSALGNGICVNKSGGELACVVTGFMRLEVDDIDGARALLPGNPVYESGGAVELLEIVED